MLLWLDGEAVILSVEQNLDLYYVAYTLEFGEISRTQWEGSKEYEIAYVDAQRDHQNAVLMQQALQETFNAIAEINEEIKRPAVLHSRVAERFEEEGYIATIRVADDTTKGIVAICVDYDPSDTSTDNATIISELIVNEMLPAGQWMIGSQSQAVVISNGQSVLAQWEIPTENSVEFTITLTEDKNSPYPTDTVDDIVIKFLANFEELNTLGNDITPATYYQIERDAPWASQIVTEYSLNGGSLTSDIYYSDYTDKFIASLPAVNVFIITV